MKNILVILALVGLTACHSVPKTSQTIAEASTQDVYPCTNGFDSVNVCQLVS
ncbi:hypothetical protein [Acinetobacter sp. NCu2D-2]|uniref:hypothetical protein n=1 Tax=Acinetobacter sp. NCu2D-2 TaxID=1608473 RepID=UPI000B012AFE|nr:hypothetical protein [Acinetobacter sp. NCu2D-2]